MAVNKIKIKHKGFWQGVSFENPKELLAAALYLIKKRKVKYADVVRKINAVRVFHKNKKDKVYRATNQVIKILQQLHKEGVV